VYGRRCTRRALVSVWEEVYKEGAGEPYVYSCIDEVLWIDVAF
jgi:hypothetical protein